VTSAHALGRGGEGEVIKISNIFDVSKLVSTHYGKRAGSTYLMKSKKL